MSGSVDPVILDEQGILLYNIDKLTKNRSKIAIEQTTKTFDPSQAASNYKNSLNSTTYENLANVCLIDTNNPSTFMNLLKTEPKISDLLLKMSTFELSSLVPVIRIFKIFHNPATKEETILEIPFDTTAKGIEQIYETSAGRGAGAGITSVEWKQNPKNEAAVSSYKVAIKMHLQSIEELIIKRSSATTKEGKILSAGIEDLLYQRRDWRVASNEGTAIYNPDYYNIKLVVGWQISEDGLQSIRENSNRTDIDKFIDALKEQKEILYLTFVSHSIEFNEDGSIELHMDFIGRADSNASDLEKCNILTTGKGFETEIQSVKDEIKALEEKNQDLIEEKKAQTAEREGQVIGSFLNKISYDTDAEDLMEVNEKELNNLKEKLTNIQKSSKMAKYNYLLTRMFQKKHIHIFSYDVKLIELVSKLRGVPNLGKETDLKNFEEYKKRNNAVKQRIQQVNEEDKKAAQMTGIKQTVAGTLTPNNTNDITPDAREAIQNAAGIKTDFSANPSVSPIVNSSLKSAAISQEIYGLKAMGDEETGEAQEELFKLVEGGNFASTSPVPKGKKRFAFFYLSSLIDALLEPILNNNKKNPNFINKKMRVILGPMNLIDYGSIQDNGKVYRIFESVEGSDEKQEKFVKVFEGKQQTINIGDIPISLKEFQRWFNEHIVNKNVDQMTFNEFVSLLVNDLILSSLTSQLYTFAPKQKAKLAISNFTSIVGEHNESAFASNILNYPWDGGVNKKITPAGGGFRIDQSALTSLKTSGKNIEKDHDITSDSYLPSKDYCVIYCINEAPYKRVGDFERDREDGILHLYAGDSKGVIRNLKFSRIDNPNRRAENILSATSEGRGFSKIIREKYNVNIEMFGNTNLQAGTYIFLSPTYSGLSGVNVVEKILRDIGLGGYYFITEVHSNIEIGDFRTSIKGVWSAFGDGTMNDGDKEYAPVAKDVQTTRGVLI